MKLDNSVKPSRDWAEANSEGRKKADALIHRIISDENPLLLGWTLKEMISTGEFGGMEVGFAHELAECLIRGSVNVRRDSAG
jgi:hypothetical protein